MATATPPTQTEGRRPKTDGWLWGIVVLAIWLRIAAVWAFPGELNKDRDAYLGIARAVAAGDGFLDAGIGATNRLIALRFTRCSSRPSPGPASSGCEPRCRWPLGGGAVLLTWVATRRLTEPEPSPLVTLPPGHHGSPPGSWHSIPCCCSTRRR